MTTRAEADADLLEVTRLATLPEHEWRIEIVKLIQALRHNVDDNTEICANMEEAVNRDLKAINVTLKSLDDIKEILDVAKSGLKFLGWVGLAAKWVAIVAGCVTAVFTAILAGDTLWEAFHKIPAIAKEVIPK